MGALYWTMNDFTPGYTALGWEGQHAAEMFYYALQEAFFKFSALGTAGLVGVCGQAVRGGARGCAPFSTVGGAQVIAPPTRPREAPRRPA